MKKINFKKGISMLEAVIAIFILVVGLVATVKLVVNSQLHSMDARDSIIAAQLAQEGVELARNIQNNNILSNSLWNAFAAPFPTLSQAGPSNYNCRIDQNFICNAGSSCQPKISGGGLSCLVADYYLYLIPATNVYSHSFSVNKTKFQRKMIFELPADGTDATGKAIKMNITSKVWWGGSEPTIANCNIGNQCVYVKTTLTDK